MSGILITGASGFLGQALMARLRARSRVTGVGFGHATGDLRSLDLREPGTLQSLAEEIRPDVVIHAAAHRDPDFCEEHPEEARRPNFNPVRWLAARLNPASRLVLFSSDYVFDGGSPPYDEDSPRCPLNVYGRSKAEAEDLALSRPGSLVLRIPLLIGVEPAHRGAAGFILQVARQVLARQPVKVDDVLIRYPTWVSDAAEAVAFLLEREETGVFHLSGPQGGTRYAWTIKTARLLGRPFDHIAPSRTVSLRKARRPVNPALATGKLQARGFKRFTEYDVVARQVLIQAGFPVR